MRYLLFLAGLSLCVFSMILAYNGIGNWGWFLFVGFIVLAGIPFESRKHES